MKNLEILKREIKVLAFDQYGTTVDMQKGLTEAVKPFLKKKGWRGEPNSFVTWWRRTHFENSMIDALCDRGHTPYRQIGHRAVSYVMDRCGIAYTCDEVRWLIGEIEKLKCRRRAGEASVRRLWADDPIERGPRHVEGCSAVHRISVRSCHFGARGWIFQAALEDVRQGNGNHRRGPLHHPVRRQSRVRLYWCKIIRYADSVY
jgi:hypothetical protein